MRETDRATYERIITQLRGQADELTTLFRARDREVERLSRAVRRTEHDLRALDMYVTKTEEFLTDGKSTSDVRRLLEARPNLNTSESVPVEGLVMPGGMGRFPSPDPRDLNFQTPFRKHMASSSRAFRYWWTGGWWGDQQYTPHCVAYAWLHLLEDGPITWEPRAPGEGPVSDPYIVYREAQKVDEWVGENYDGTSVRAGAKVLQRQGFISTYHWIFTLAELIYHLLEKGPIVAGTWWYEGMNRPKADDGYLIKPEGRALGGHAYVLNGINVETGFVRIKNSWGRGWGNSGFAYISLSDLQKLMHGGEFCFPIELTENPREEDNEIE